MTHHRVLTVRVAEHEAADPAWRIRHAGETIALVLAWFATDSDGKPAQATDGTFEVHAVSRSTLDTLRKMLVGHEGFTITQEHEEPGLGVIVSRQEGTGDHRHES